MPAIEQLSPMIGVNPEHLSTEENFLLEIFLFFTLCDELAKILEQEANKNIFHLNHKLKKESFMTNRNFMRLILQDLINSSDYTILGIATYTQIPDEIIYDIATGINTNPSLDVSRKIIELHRRARADLYDYVIQKINTDHFVSNAARVA